MTERPATILVRSTISQTINLRGGREVVLNANESHELAIADVIHLSNPQQPGTMRLLRPTAPMVGTDIWWNAEDGIRGPGRVVVVAHCGGEYCGLVEYGDNAYFVRQSEIAEIDLQPFILLLGLAASSIVDVEERDKIIHAIATAALHLEEEG